MKFERVKTFHKAHPSLSTLITVALVGVLAGGGYYGYTQWKYMHTPDAVYQREAQTYKESWDEMMLHANKQVLLPSNEVPVLATVSDPESLDKNDFYKRAQEGDKIIMYKKNKMVLLYRPETKKVLARAQLNFLDPTPETFETVVSNVAGSSTSAQTNTTPIPTVSGNNESGLTADKLFPQ